MINKNINYAHNICKRVRRFHVHMKYSAISTRIIELNGLRYKKVSHSIHSVDKEIYHFHDDYNVSYTNREEERVLGYLKLHID